MSEWTPTDDEAASMFITGWCCDTNPETARTEPASAWSRWLAAHDRALREQIARDIEATETLLLHVEDFDKHRESIQGQINGIRAAARIARGEVGA